MNEDKDISNLTNNYSGLSKIAVAAICIAILFAIIFASYIVSILVHMEHEIKTDVEIQK